jgi:hypothetical protein
MSQKALSVQKSAMNNSSRNVDGKVPVMVESGMHRGHVDVMREAYLPFVVTYIITSPLAYQQGKVKMKRFDLQSASICQASATMSSRFPLLAEIVTMSGWILFGRRTSSVCLEGEVLTCIGGESEGDTERRERSVGDGVEEQGVPEGRLPEANEKETRGGGEGWCGAVEDNGWT